MRALWRRFWDAAPRQLRFTRAGRVLIGVALATGFAAINTGNNLLFLGWGLVLSAIALSGVLSEMALRNVELAVSLPTSARAQETSTCTLLFENRARRLPAYGLELEATIRSPQGPLRAVAPFQLHAPARLVRELLARFSPESRGRHELMQVVVRTRYPFGFFEKSRRYPLKGRVEVWVKPPAVDVEHLLSAIVTRLGEASSPHSGVGDEYFGLRPFRPGDDPRRVYVRRSIKTRRWVVRETETSTGQTVVLELVLAEAADAPRERAIASLGSLAEALLARGFAVGIIAPGIALTPSFGASFGEVVLQALARLDPDAPKKPLSLRGGTTRVALLAADAKAPAGMDLVLRAAS